MCKNRKRKYICIQYADVSYRLLNVIVTVTPIAKRNHGHFSNSDKVVCTDKSIRRQQQRRRRHWHNETYLIALYAQRMYVISRIAIRFNSNRCATYQVVASVIYINRVLCRLCFAVWESKTNCIRGACEIRNMHDNNKTHVEKDWLNRSFFGMFSKKEMWMVLVNNTARSKKIDSQPKWTSRTSANVFNRM